MGSSAFDLIARVRSEPAPGVRTLNSSRQRRGAQVVAKALVKRPEDATANAGEMLQDLDRLLRGEPTSLVAHPRGRHVTPATWSPSRSAGSSSPRPAALALGLEHRAAEPCPGPAGRLVPQPSPTRPVG